MGCGSVLVRSRMVMVVSRVATRVGDYNVLTSWVKMADCMYDRCQLAKAQRNNHE